MVKIIVSTIKHKISAINNYGEAVVVISLILFWLNYLLLINCDKNRNQLENKAIGLFVCGMNKANEQVQLVNTYPEYLHNIALAKGILGGEYLFEKMNFIERFLIKKMVKVYSSASNLDIEAIKLFSEKIK